MLRGLRTIVYHVCNLEVAKMWYAEMFQIEPYFAENFYVGFDIGGCELGLDPSDKEYTPGNSSITYWSVEDIDKAFETFKTKKVNIHQEVHSVGEGIRLGSINDPFGNIIGLIQTSGG